MYSGLDIWGTHKYVKKLLNLGKNWARVRGGLLCKVNM